MRPYSRRDWWVSDPAVVMCEICGCPIQRTPNGTVADGLRLHVKFVHTGSEVETRPKAATS